MKETEYRVIGMTCQGCVKALGRALDVAAPGLDYDIVLEVGALTVRGPHETAVVAQAVSDAGFDLEPPWSAA